MRKPLWFVAALLVGFLGGGAGLYAQGGISTLFNLRGSSTLTGSVPSLNVAVVDANGAQITAFGGGTSDTDDGTIAGGQSSGISLALEQVWDGSSWKRLTIGTAGAPSAQVLTIQGVTSMTPLSVSAAQSGTWSVGQIGSPWGFLGTLSNNNAATGSNLIDAMVGTVGASAPSYTDGRSVKWRMDTGGAGYVNVNNPSPVDANSYPLVSPGATATSTGSAAPCYIQSGTGTLADTSNHANCKASAGNFYGFRAINTSATLAYLRMYNLTTDPTCTSATGFIESIPIPASATGAGITDHVGPPIPYATGIGYCITATGANTNNGAPPVGVFVTLFTK